MAVENCKSEKAPMVNSGCRFTVLLLQPNWRIERRAMKKIIDVEINPSERALLSMGASRDDFSTALNAALNRLAGISPNKLPTPAEIPIHLQGQDRLLGEVAVIRVRFAPDAPHFRC
jgi:hypothetical protein